MTLAETLFRPFETLIKPLDLPVGPIPDQGAFAVIWHFAKMFRHVLVVVGLLSILSSLIGIVLVWSLAFVIDGVNTQSAAEFLSSNATTLICLVVLFAVVDPVLTFVRSAFMSQTVQVLLSSAMRWQSHKAIESQDLAFFEDIFAGQVASRIGQVVGSVQRQLMVAMQTVPRVVIQFVGSFTLLAALAPPLAAPVLIWIVANVALAWYAVPLYTARAGKVAAATSRATGALTDVYSNISMVKQFSAEDAESGAIRTVIGQTIDTQHAENRAYILTDTAVNLLNVALLISLIAISLWGLTAGTVSLGEFAAAATIARSLSNSSGAFIGLGQAMSRTIGTIRDAMPVMTTRPTVTDRSDAPDLSVTAGSIRFDRVDFAYPAGADAGQVIRQLSLSIAPGEKVGLIGVSGAGKSTLVALLLRLRDVDGGSISIDGQNVRDVRQASLRRSIGVVSQDSAMLHRSIRDNIRYGRPEATDAEVWDVARMAQADGFIASLKDAKGRSGLDAFAGDRGVKLSGGQRQRISIARVLLKDAPILVLDEATSSLDSEAEAAIQSELDMLMAGKTVIAIAHRLSTIAAMDRLVVMDQGRIVEEGTHDVLVARGGTYAGLWKRQSGGFLTGSGQAADARYSP